MKASPLNFPNKKVVFIGNKYNKERIAAVYNGDVYTITNLTPDIHKDDRQERKNEIEKTLYAVFSKYTPTQKPRKQHGGL